MEIYFVNFKCPQCGQDHQEPKLKPHRKAVVHKVCEVCKTTHQNTSVAQEGYNCFEKGSCGNCIFYMTHTEWYGTCTKGYNGVVADHNNKQTVTPYIYSGDTCPEQKDKEC